MKSASLEGGKKDLRGLTRTQLVEHLQDIGIPSSRAPQLFSMLHQIDGSDLSGYSGLKKEFRDALARTSYLSSIEPIKIERSQDGTVKYGFLLRDGSVVESVLIPGEGRDTLCVSSQVGCAMGCRFCLTGTMGFKRNLQPAEIVNQVIAVMENMNREGHKNLQAREIINNLVFMGMGEPLANYDNLLTALTILMDEKGLEFTERRVTVSTCGIVPGIAALGRDTRVNLAVSLHAADDATRSKLMPINRKYPVDVLLDACRSYPLARKKVILFEYILISGINDTATHAHELTKKLMGIPCRINLMPFNECDSLPYRSPGQEIVKEFQAVLRRAGFMALVRNSRGADISAACGQLARVA